MDADEGRNAEVAREMAETNDYVMPRLNGLPYLDKPVVYFAAAAAVMEVHGPTELAARLPAYTFTLATMFVLFLFARRMWGDEAGLVAAIAFMSMPLTIAFARIVIFDSALTFFVTVALLAMLLAVEESSSRWSVLAWAAMGLAMITKGPVVFVLVLFVTVPYAIWQKRLRFLFPLTGLVLFAASVVPWVWGVSDVVPEFLRYVLVTETVERMATKALQRTGPPWYFVPYMLFGALPWSFVLLASWRELRKRDRLVVFLLLAVLIPLVFFSISQSKRPQYVLPLMAPLALLVARIWPEVKTRAAAIVLAVLGVTLLALPLFVERFRMKPEIAEVVPGTALALGAAALAGAMLALFGRRRELVLIGLTLPMVALPVLSTQLMKGIAQRRSAKAFVAQLGPYLTPETSIVGVEAFTGSMQFYLRRPVTLLTPNATEMTSNYLVRRYDRYVSNPASPIKPLSRLDASLRECCSPRIYIVRQKDPEHQVSLEARGLHRIASSAHHVAYGPWRGPNTMRPRD